MGRFAFPLVFVAWLLSCGTANAETAAEVGGWCLPYDEVYAGAEGRFTNPGGHEADLCWGAFAAVQELLRLVEPVHMRPFLPVCAPETSTRLQLIHIYRRYIAEHPERENSDFQLVLMDALQKAFPCKN